MRGFAAACLAWVALAVPMLSAGYDDLTRGVTANTRGESDIAIEAFSAALKAPDLIPAYVPAAYRGRATAYLETGKCREAQSDLDAATALKPLDPTGYALRAYIKVCLKDITGAQQDLDTAMGPEPDSAVYSDFGRHLWHLGLFEEAHTNLLRSVEVLDKRGRETSTGYTVLWYAMAAERIGKQDKVKLEEFTDKLDSSDWPMPIIKLFLGKFDADKTRSKMDRVGSEAYVGQKCEADFYIGEWQIAHGNADAAKPLIAAAMASCPKSFIEYPPAQDEAKRLGLPLAKE